MRLFHILRSIVYVRIICADPIGLVSELVNHGFDLQNVSVEDDLTIVVIIAHKDEKRLGTFLAYKGISFSVYKRKGIAYSALKILKRPILLFGLMLFTIITLLLPNRILFICVEGNEKVSTEQILSSAEQAGIHFGASRKNIRSEKIKNHLLEIIPQLQWVGVNTHGCVALITVKEEVLPETDAATKGIYSIVASRDCVIRQMTVHKGNPICTVGQPVRKGQVIVSGYTDCGDWIRSECAEAEVFGDTLRYITAKALMTYERRVRKKNTDTKFSIVCGKKRINLFKDTGNLDTSCVKMYKQYYIVLPGSFVLPFSLLTSTEIGFESEPALSSEDIDFGWVDNAVVVYLHEQMSSGCVLSKVTKTESADDVLIYYGAFACREMVGKKRSEEIYTIDEYTG